MSDSKAYNLFLAYGRAERLYAPETMRNLIDAFRNWILPVLGEIPIEQVDQQTVLTLRTRMATRGLSVSRQYGVIMWLKTYLRFCRTHLAVQVLDPASIALPRRPAPHVDYLTNDEVRLLLGAIPMHTYAGKRLRALIELLLGTGLRIGEALALDRKSFDDGVRELRIVGKGGKQRTVFFSTRSMRWVGLYLSSRADNSPALFVTTGDAPRRVARADVSRMFIQLRTKAGVSKRVTPHLLRHTYCTNLLNNGTDIRFIRDLAGHADIATTARYYLGIDDAKLREIVDARLNYDPPAGVSPSAPA